MCRHKGTASSPLPNRQLTRTPAQTSPQTAGRPGGSAGTSRVLLGLGSHRGAGCIWSRDRGGERSPAASGPLPVTRHLHRLTAVCGPETCSGCRRPVGPGLSGGPLGTSRLPGARQAVLTQVLSPRQGANGMHVPRKRPVASPPAPREPSAVDGGAWVPWAGGHPDAAPTYPAAPPPTPSSRAPPGGRSGASALCYRERLRRGQVRPLPGTPHTDCGSLRLPAGLHSAG